MIIKENFKSGGRNIRKLVSFESYGEFCEWGEKNNYRKKLSETANRYDRCGGNFNKNRGDWFGSASIEETVELSRHGWPEGLKKAQEITAEIENNLFSMLKKRTSEYHYAGGVPDVGVFLANDPECFLSFKDKEEKGVGKLVRFVVNLTASGGYSSDQLMMRGIAILAAVDALEHQGRSCEVVAFTAASNGASHWEIEIPLKRQGEQADMERIAFAIANPSFYRRLVFNAWDIIEYPGYGYGAIEEAYAIDKGDKYFPAIDWKQCPMDNADLLKWVLEILREQGIELEGA
jgi:hypothetical protein